MSFFQRFSLYSDPVDGSTLIRYQCSTHDTSAVLFAASSVLVNCTKKSKLKLLNVDLYTLSMATAPKMENDERADPDGSADIS